MRRMTTSDMTWDIFKIEIIKELEYGVGWW